MSTLLRAPMDQTILADVHVARSRPALPRVRAAAGEVALKQAVGRARGEAARELHDLFIARSTRRIDRHDLTRFAVNQADRGAEAERLRALRYHQRILRMTDARSDHRVDVDVEWGQLGQPAELLVQHFQALVGHRIGIDVVHADLQPIEPGVVEALDALWG